MMNRKLSLSCVTCSRNHICQTTSQSCDGSDCKRGAVSRGSSDSVSLQNLLDNRGVWKLPLSIYQISPYKMAPCVFNGIIFLFGSSVKPWRSLLAAHFNLCIDSDVQKRHRIVPIKQPWASLTPGRKRFSSGEKHSAPVRKVLNLTKPILQRGIFWFGRQ